jgi:photosystem II stability/assembly factor-like uncharacterized protein
MFTRLALLLIGLAFAGQAPPQVTRTEQVSGTDALLIAVSPVDDNVAWVSGQRGTWLRTTDGGRTWQSGQVPGAAELQFRDVHAVDASTAYLLSIGEGSQSRIYKTADAGATWALQFTNDDARGFYDCFDFWDASRGLVIGDSIDGTVSMLTTSDGGATWSRVPPQSLPQAPAGEGSFAASGTCLSTRPGGLAWVVASTPTAARVLSTADYGRTWTAAPLPITTHQGVGPQSIAFADDRRGVVLGGGNTAQPDDVLAAMTDDGGRTWTPRTRPPMPRGVWGGAVVPGAGILTLVAVGPDGAVYSRDAGVTWTALDAQNYWSVAFASPRAGWAVGAQGRITRLAF